MKAITMTMALMSLLTGCATERLEVQGEPMTEETGFRYKLVGADHMVYYQHPPDLVAEGGACKIVSQCNFGLDCMDGACKRKARR